MNRRWLLNIALLVVIGALALVVVLRPGKRDGDAGGPPLLSLAPEAITQLRVERPGKETLAFERRGNDWHMTAPHKARAGTFRISELTRLASTRSESSFPAVEGELARYGLDRPRARVRINDTEIALGSKHPMRYSQYVRVGDEVHLISAGSERTLEAPTTDFLSTSLLEEQLKLTALTLPQFALTLDAQGAWTLKPARKDINADRLTRYVDEWRFARALSAAPYSGAAIRKKVLLRMADDSPIKQIEIGVLKEKPELLLYRKDEGIEYRFPEETGQRLLELKPDDAGTPGG